MDQVKAAFISFGCYAYPRDYILARSREVFDAAVREGLNAQYYGPVIELADAQAVVNQLETAGFDYVIAHITTWTMTPIVMRVLRELRHRPLLVWGMGGRTEDGTLISPASPAGASALLFPLRQFGIKYKYVYDHPDSPPKISEALDFAAVVQAMKNINGSKIGVMGYCDMGLYALMLDGVALKRQLGMDVEDIFSHEIGVTAAAAPKSGVDQIVEEMRRDLRFDAEPTYEQLEKTARLTWALRKKVAENHYLGVTMKCVYGVSRYMDTTPCLTQALLAKDVPSICESDVAGLVTEVILHQLSGQSSTFLEHYEYYPDRILAGVCGFAPFDMTQGGCGVKCMCAGWGGFTGLYQTQPLKTGLLTVARLYSEKGALKMLLLTADSQSPGKWAELGWEAPMPEFPSLVLKPDCPMEFYIENVPAQHVNVVYGDYTRQIREFCRLTGIEVIQYKGAGA